MSPHWQSASAVPSTLKHYIKGDKTFFQRELEKVKIQFSKLEKDLKLKDEIIEEQLVYASTQEDYYQYKIKYNQLRNIFDTRWQ